MVHNFKLPIFIHSPVRVIDVHWLVSALNSIVHHEPQFWDTPLLQSLAVFVELKTGTKTLRGIDWEEEYYVLHEFCKELYRRDSAAYRSFLGRGSMVTTPDSFNFTGPSSNTLERDLPQPSYRSGPEEKAISLWLRCHREFLSTGAELVFRTPGTSNFPDALVVPATLSFDAMNINPSGTYKEGVLYGTIPEITEELAAELMSGQSGMQDVMARLKQLPFAKSAEEYVLCGLRGTFAWPVGVHYLGGNAEVDGSVLGKGCCFTYCLYSI